MNMSAKMSAYNAAKAWALRSGLTDAGRVNRALGILQKEGALDRAVVKYSATINHCDCPDSQSGRGFACKHRVALMLFKKHQRIMNEELDLDLPEDFEPSGESADVLDPNDAAEALKMWTSY